MPLCTRTFVRLFAVLLVSLAALPASAQSRLAAPIVGRVIDEATAGPLPGALVSVDGTTRSTTTDRDGVFRLEGLSAGPQTIVVSYLGRKTTKQSVRAGADDASTVIVRLPLDTDYKETVTVTPLLLDAQARSLNQQKTALNITNIVSADQIGHFPDPNAAEVTQRIPGVSIQRDQGEGRYVIVRGTEPRLNSMLINGERIPSPEADVRQVALDVVPADLLQAVEVSKTMTPDMDGDAIGGAVNLITKQAPSHLAVSGALAGGYNRSLGSADQHNASGTMGGRLFGGKAGLIVGASSNGTTRGNEDFEPVYTSGALTDLDLRAYVVNRRRRGATGTFDMRSSPNALFTVRGMYNYFIDDHEQRQQFRNRVANRRIERVLRDRTHVEKIWNLSFTGHQILGAVTLDYQIQGAQSSQFDPGTITTTFRQSNVNFSPNVTPTSIDPDNVQANPLNENLASSTFNSQVRAINSNRDRDIVGGLDLRLLALTRPNLTMFVKGGFKVRDKDKERTRDEVSLASPTAILISRALAGDGVQHTLLGGRYAFGPFIDMAAADALGDTGLTSTVNHARDSEDQTTAEQVSAFYGMAEMYFGPRLLILPGVRVEHFSADYVANDVQFSPSGAWVSTTPITGSSRNTEVLPDVLARFAFNDSTNFRAGLTRTLARPNYISQIPNRQLDDQANTLSIGNPDLQPTLSWNGDLMVEKYLKSVGLLSAGVFYKHLTDYIYSFTSTEMINGELFTVTQPLNGEAASVRGLELAVQSHLTFLPKALKNIGVYGNYTLTDSSAVFPGRTGEATLPGQSRHVGNLAMSYEQAGFSGRAAINFHGSYVDMVAASAGLDRFYDTHKQVDISISQELRRGFRVYFDALNLTDAPLRYYQGTPDRPLQEEHYLWWVNFGVKINWSEK